MKTLFVVTLLFCLGKHVFVSKNVLFDKIISQLSSTSCFELKNKEEMQIVETADTSEKLYEHYYDVIIV